ncbi:MAG: hypothetical protein PHO56_03385 [Patescibacteria group bacterium]|nr:hypothetical protein [Patescibacteria group bacterium]
MEKLEAYLIFFGKEGQLHRFYSGEITVDDDWGNFSGSVNLPDSDRLHVIKITKGRFQEDIVFFDFNCGGLEYHADLSAQSVMYRWGLTSLGLDGKYWPVGKKDESYPIMAAFRKIPD